MSVLVKGMKMPDSCRHCCMMTGTFCDILNIDVDPFYDGEKHRNVCCPLVELPEKHGRLIDVDELIEDLKHDVAIDQDFLDYYGELTEISRRLIQDDKDIKQNTIDLLEHTRGIIEAEGEG